MSTLAETMEKDHFPTGGVAVVEIDDDYTAEDEALAKNALRRIDLTVIPAFAIIFMMCNLDRSNIGNANLTGFSKDLGLVGNQYGAAVSVVYSTYVFFEPVATVLLKVITPRIMLSVTTISWGVITIGTAFVKTWPQLMACRVLLGVFEAAVFPCIQLYITMTYNRDEYTSRLTWIYVANCMSGAFGGLLAYGLSQIDAHNMHGWQWMYFVEGIISVSLMPVAYFLIPSNPTDCRFFKPAERAAFVKRQARNRRIYDDRDKFSWVAILSAWKDPRIYISCISQFGMLCTVYSLTTFMPKIVAGLGFTSTVNAQLLTVPVYFVAAAGFVALGYMSDRYKRRSPFILISLACNLVGFIFLAVTDNVGVRYAGVFIGSIGLYSGGSLNNMWTADNNGGHYKRAMSMGMQQLVGNSAGASIGFIFTAQTAPRYLKGLYFDVGMVCVSAICCCSTALYLRHLNRKKQDMIATGAPDDPSLGDKNPHYSFYL